MKKIIISEYVKMGMTEGQGLKIRNAIGQHINSEDYIELDFHGISLFATMFFNAFIGYYAEKLTPNLCLEKIKLTNISELGMETYQHSFDNAKTVIKNNDIGKITAESIEEA